MFGRRQAPQGRYYGGTGDPYSRRGRGAGTGRFKLFLIIGLGMAGFQAFKYFTNTQVNPVTGETQRVQWTMDEEIALGLQSAPKMAQQHGGYHPDERAQQLLKSVGEKLANTPTARKSQYPYNFYLLRDDKAVNAFALPGGQTFITAALFSRLNTEDQLAGVMGHELGHVIERHGAERMARSGFIQGLVQSVMIGAGGDYSAGQIASVIGNYQSMKYGREQELESDEWGVRLMMEAGYDPEELITVMDILAEASGGSRVPEFQSTHPDPGNRKERIKEAIKKYRDMGIGR